MALRLTAKFITTAEAADRVGTTMRHVQKLCREGKVPGATMFGGVWMVPSTFRWKPQKRGPKKRVLKKRGLIRRKPKKQ
jgi:excisionase family DNA binding protein